MLEIEIEEGLIVLSGSFDAQDEEMARKALEAVAESAVVDAAGLEYLSSAGIGVLFAVQKRLQSTGHKLTLINLQPFIAKVFKLANLAPFFGIE